MGGVGGGVGVVGVVEGGGDEDEQAGGGGGGSGYWEAGGGDRGSSQSPRTTATTTKREMTRAHKTKRGQEQEAAKSRTKRSYQDQPTLMQLGPGAGSLCESRIKKRVPISPHKPSSQTPHPPSEPAGHNQSGARIRVPRHPWNLD